MSHCFVEVTKSDAEEKAEVKESPKKSQNPRRTKQALKEQLKEQKVLVKKMALRSRRERTRNRKYMSDEFMTIFNEKKQAVCSDSYSEVVETVEESVEIGGASVSTAGQVDYTHGVPTYGDKSPATPTQDEHYVYSNPDNEIVVAAETPGIPIYEVGSSVTIGQLNHMTRSRSKRMSSDRSETQSRPDTPYSDISDSSKSESLPEGRGRRSSRRKKEESEPEAKIPKGRPSTPPEPSPRSTNKDPTR